MFFHWIIKDFIKQILLSSSVLVMWEIMGFFLFGLIWFYVWGPYWVIFRAYFWLCPLGSFLVGFDRPCGGPGNKPCSATCKAIIWKACKASTIPFVLSLGSHNFNYSQSLVITSSTNICDDHIFCTSIRKIVEFPL